MLNLFRCIQNEVILLRLPQDIQYAVIVNGDLVNNDILPTRLVQTFSFDRCIDDKFVEGESKDINRDVNGLGNLENENG